MNNFHCDGRSLWTGSAIADGVLDFARAVIDAGGTSRVLIPIRTESADLVVTELVIGPDSRVAGVDLGPGPGEIVNTALVCVLADATEWWRARIAQPSTNAGIRTRVGASVPAADVSSAQV